MQVSITIPTMDKDGNTCPSFVRTRLMNDIRNVILETFGGLTETDSRGIWRDEKTREIHSEKVTVIESYIHLENINSEFPEAVVEGTLKACASMIKIDLRQETVFYTIDNDAFFFTGE